MKVKLINIDSCKTWRKWLEKNYDKEIKVGIVLHKKHTGKPSISHKESMEEAICFGWIDTTIKRVDEDRYMRCFAKRTKNSKWSNNTLSYGKDLIERGLMTPHGLKMYKEGLLKPTHDEDIPKNPETPKDLIKELNKNKIKDKFDRLAPSTKKMYNR